MRTEKNLFATLALGACVSAAAQQEPVLPKVKAQDEEAVTQTRSATKTDTPLIDVPQAVSVIDATRLAEQGLRSMADVALYVPGLSMGQGEGHRDAPTLRGNASTADFFVNGVRDDVQYFRDFYNIERVEVLKGPNAMIFGRGGGGGVINRVTRQADFETHRTVTLQAGSFDFKRATVDVGQGASDSLALRLTGVYEDSESYRDFLQVERYGVNPTLTWTLAPNSVLQFGVERFDDSRTVDRGVPSQNGRPVLVDESTFFGNPAASYSDFNVTLARAAFEHRFSDDLALRNQLVYGDYDKYYQNTYPSNSVQTNGAVPLDAYRSGTVRENLFNQTDLTWNLATGSINHTVLAGVEVGRQDTDNVRNNSVSGAAGSVTLINTVTYTAPGVLYTVANQNNHVDTSVAAIYVQDQIELSQHWQVLAGLRVDRFKIELANRINGQRFEREEDLVSPRAGLVYKPMQSMSVYTSYSVSYLPSSGDQFASLDVTSAALKPEEFENVEVGLKWNVQPNLTLNLAVYQLDRTNTRAPSSGSTPVLTGAQRSEGVELEVNGSLSDDWQIAAGYSYQDAEITRTTTAASVGQRIPLVPDHQASLWNSYRLSPMFRAAVGVVYQSEVFASISNLVRLPSFTRVDAAVFANLTERLTLQLNLENLLDRTYWRTAHNDNNITPGSPIAGRVTLSASF